MSTKLYVGNLPYQTTESDLQALFEGSGQVASINVVRDRATGQARGFAFVEMSDTEGAQKAIKDLDRHEYGGRNLTVNEAKPMAPRGAGRRQRRRRRLRPSAARSALVRDAALHLPFTQLHLHPDLLKGIRDLGFTRPTPIQSEAIPPAMSGRDLLACAQTGSGKTAAFLLPILHQLLSAPRRTTRALILTPTRELAAQILEDFNGLAVHTPVTGAAIFGGVSMGPQEHAFRSGVDVMVATPGRLLDHATRPYAKLAGIEYLVLDEADRMLDMGFLPDIKRILRHIPQKRQTLFFSATMPTEIGRLAADLLKNPATIALQRQAAPAAGITQAAYPVPQHLKATLLGGALEAGSDAAGARVHAHQAPRQPAGRASVESGGQRRAHSRQPLAGPAHAGARRIQERPLHRARRDGYCRARHRHRRAQPRDQLRCAGRAGRLHPPRGPYWTCGDDRRGVHVRGAG
jgi:hypothetical protein